MKMLSLTRATIALALVSLPAAAELTRIEITSRAAVLNGKSFGLAGPYESITGKAYFAVDPTAAVNKPIVDLDKATRNVQGRVEFSADVFILQPKDASRGNGVALFDVPNRGRKMLLRTFDHATQATDPKIEADFGDGYLLRQGYTLIFLGWQFDVAHRAGLMALDAPPLAIAGRVFTAFTADTTGTTHEFGNDGYYTGRAYTPADLASPANQMTVREGQLGEQRVIPREQWQLMPGSVSLKSGFEPGKTYEITYETKTGFVAGAAFAAFRDFAAYVKHAPAGSPVSARYAYVFGASQDGRFLRDFLYEGFNADERGGRAFDGVMAHIAGASRGDFNVHFASPGGLGAFSATRFPYLDSPQFDPVTGKTDGMLSRLTPETMPRIIYTNSSTEYWGGGRAAALTHTTLDGKEDAKVPDNVRIYHFSGTQHSPALEGTASRLTASESNPNDYAWGQRALLAALDRWVREGAAPPASRHPNLGNGTLVARDTLAFPAIPGVRSPLGIPGPFRSDLDGGPSAHPLPFLVPKVDADGNELGGIRFPEVSVPLATYTGWNFRNPSIGAPGEIYPLVGTYAPFAATKAARAKTSDPRLSIEERYASREAYLGQVTEAALQLIQEGYVLREDLAGIVNQAAARWDSLMKGVQVAAAK